MGSAEHEGSFFPVRATSRAGLASRAITQVQMRCTGCNRRLGDYVNEVEGGMVILELKCPKCGQPHTEVLRRS
jgi:hypothetical protein